jgi:alkanesulfonate monooxygenase SsuD/methylene tetrahydromethanopterin reductase-like flavin-dependent oxidoreductase (luciferase family)
MTTVAARRRTRPGNLSTWAEVEKANYVIVGSPQTVADRLKAIALETGLGTLIPNFVLGDLPHELTRKSIELFAREVMPKLRNVNVDEPRPEPVAVGAARG